MLQFLRHFCVPRAQSNSLQFAGLRRSISSNDLSSCIDALSRRLQGKIPHRHLLQIHARIFPLDAHQDNLIATRLIGHYSSNSALKVFNSLRNPNVFPFNAIIRVLAEEGLFWKAACFYKGLKFQPLSPNELTFSFLLKAFSRDFMDANSVRQIHSDVVKLGFTSDPFVSNSLLMVYAKRIRDIRSALQVFEEMPDKNLICSWTSLISGYAKLGLAEESLSLFTTMLTENLCPESATMVSVLSACSSLDSHLISKWINLLEQYAVKLNSNISDYAKIILVYLHGRHRKIEKSREIFDEISDDGKRSVLCWNVMIGAYVQNGIPSDALLVFKLMMGSYNCRPNHVTMVSVLSACGEIGDLEFGSRVHEYIRNNGQKGVVSFNVNLATALIDMYLKCGKLDGARNVFNGMSRKDVVSFNAMIMGLAINGEGDEALNLFYKMEHLGLYPDSGTFLGALCACNHSGMLQKGREIFDKMIEDKNVVPRLEHYACYIDLLSRSGYIEEALGVVEGMPFQPNNYVWGSLVTGCVVHNRLEMSRVFSSMLVEVDPRNSGGYVMLSNSFAADRKWRDVLHSRGVMREKGVGKQPGCSWINVDGVVHEFVAGSGSLCGFGCVHETMESLLKEMRLSSC